MWRDEDKASGQSPGAAPENKPQTQVVWEGHTKGPPPPQVPGAFLGSPPHPAVISGSSLEPLASHVVPPYRVSVPPRPTGWGLTKPFRSPSKLGQ